MSRHTFTGLSPSLRDREPHQGWHTQHLTRQHWTPQHWAPQHWPSQYWGWPHQHSQSPAECGPQTVPVPRELYASTDTPEVTTSVGGLRGVIAVLDYLAVQASDASVQVSTTLGSVQSDWRVTALTQDQYGLQELQLAAGAEIKLSVVGAAARLRWFEIVVLEAPSAN